MIDYEYIGNFSDDDFEHDVSPLDSLYYIAHEILFVVLALIAIVADGFIIYVMFRYEKMRSVPNTILANWAIADICFLITSPSGYRIISVIDNVSLSHEFFCFLLQLGATFHATVLMFILVMCIDWCLAAYWEKLSQKFRYYYKFTIASVWIFAFLTGSVASGFCLRHYYFHFTHGYFLLFGYAAIYIFVLGLQLHRLVRKCRGRFLDYSTLMLSIVSASAACWFVGFIELITAAKTSLDHPIIIIIGICFIYCTSIANFIILCRKNEEFKSCFLHAIKRRDSLKEQENFVFRNPIVKREIAPISYNKNEELLANAS